MESKKNINGMDYVLAGDYYIPDLKLPNEERPIGKYGRMHLEYLKEHSPMRFNDLVLEGCPAQSKTPPASIPTRRSPRPLPAQIE